MALTARLGQNSDKHAVDHHYEVFPLLEFEVKKDTAAACLEAKSKNVLFTKRPIKDGHQGHFSFVFKMRQKFVLLSNFKVGIQLHM